VYRRNNGFGQSMIYVRNMRSLMYMDSLCDVGVNSAYRAFIYSSYTIVSPSA
jgi:hypothetical protein